jgi:hypothetical protein
LGCADCTFAAALIERVVTEMKETKWPNIFLKKFNKNLVVKLGCLYLCGPFNTEGFKENKYGT